MLSWILKKKQTQRSYSKCIQNIEIYNSVGVKLKNAFQRTKRINKQIEWTMVNSAKCAINSRCTRNWNKILLHVIMFCSEVALWVKQRQQYPLWPITMWEWARREKEQNYYCYYYYYYYSRYLLYAGYLHLYSWDKPCC
jgi:hypothetical protein